MINKDNITDLFFDLDHTLWDFETNSQHTFASILAPYAFSFTIDKFMEAYTPINHALLEVVPREQNFYPRIALVAFRKNI